MRSHGARNSLGPRGGLGYIGHVDARMGRAIAHRREPLMTILDRVVRSLVPFRSRA